MGYEEANVNSSLMKALWNASQQQTAAHLPGGGVPQMRLSHTIDNLASEPGIQTKK
jgi:hypothetical protein